MTDQKKPPELDDASAEGHIENTPEHNNADGHGSEHFPLGAADLEATPPHMLEGPDAEEQELAVQDDEPCAEDNGPAVEGEPMPTPDQAERERSAARFVAAMVKIGEYAHAKFQGLDKPFVPILPDRPEPAAALVPLHEIAPAQSRQPLKERAYDELLAAAHTLATDADPETIKHLAREAGVLDSVERGHILRIIKNRTGTTLGDLRGFIRDSGPQSLDDLSLARGVLDAVGRANIFGTEAAVYCWNPQGVWQPMQEIAVKQLVQNGLEKIAPVNANSVNNVASVLKNEIYVPRIELNRGDPSTVNTRNGELVLNTDSGLWELQTHNRDAYRTTQIPIQYDPNATAPRFDQFMNEIFRDDDDREEKIESLLQLVGYSLMSHCRYEKFVIFIGNGANGKSVLLAVLEALLGIENVASIQPSLFDNPFYRAHLYMKLANFVTELKEGEVIADAALKSIVSGESTTASRKFQHPFDFRPYATCFFGTNHMPHTRDFSDALFRRAVILRFNRRFDAAKGEADPLLKDKLIGELPGILNMALDAYSRWQLTGKFTEPKSSQSAKGEWRLEADQVQQFVGDCCSRDPKERVQSQQLYNDYRRWADECGINQRLTQKSFVSRLERLGFGRARTNAGKYITGIIINSG